MEAIRNGEMEVPHLAKARFGMTGRIDGGRRQRQAWVGTARPRLPLPPQKKINVIPNEAQQNEESPARYRSGYQVILWSRGDKRIYNYEFGQI